MPANDPYDRERNGANAGLNPMFGDWQHRFDIAPVPYGDGGAKRADLRRAMQAQLTNKFFYSREVRLEITLHMDVQSILETSDTADLDNYAKVILDGLKGPGGILLDDAQVQTLIVSWLDTTEPPHFDISISSSPDDFILNPVSFYEMPDSLWYPVSRRMWSKGGTEDESDCNHYAGLLIHELMSSAQRSVRHTLRQAGSDRLRAYQGAVYLSSSLRGFHKSRIDEGFDKHELKNWRSAFAAWKETHGAEIGEIEVILAGLKKTYLELGDALAGKLPAVV